MQPAYKRFDPGVIIRDALRAYATGEVVLARDADYEPDHLTTVVQISQFAPAGTLPSNRWAFNVSCTLVTSGPGPDGVLDELETLCDGLLSHNREGGVLIHTVRVVSEPMLTAPHDPSGAVAAAASFSLIMRRKEQHHG